MLRAERDVAFGGEAAGVDGIDGDAGGFELVVDIAQDVRAFADGGCCEGHGGCGRGLVGRGLGGVWRRAHGSGRGKRGEAVEQKCCRAAGEPEDVLAAGNLAEIDADLAERVGVGAILAADDEDAGDGAVDGGLQKSVVGGEGLQEGGVVAVAREDGDGLAGRAEP